MKVILALPAYNEQQDLPGLLDRIDNALKSWADYRVLVVDDGSTDNTAQIVRDAGQNKPVTLIQHTQNRGLGAAIRTGLSAASAEPCDVVVTLDADNSQPPELIEQMVSAIATGKSDVVIASRFQPGAQEVGVPWHRVILSHVSSGMIRLIIPYRGARDYTCGFRAYRPAILATLIDRFGDHFVRENSFACMLEVLINCRRIGARVSEVPLVLRYDLKQGASKMRIWRTMKRYGITVLRAYLPLRKPVQAVTALEPRQQPEPTQSKQDTMQESPLND